MKSAYKKYLYFSLALMVLFINGCSYLDINLFKNKAVQQTPITPEVVVVEKTDNNENDYLRSIYSEDVDELLNLVHYKDKAIDSLYTTIEYFYFKVDSLQQELEFYNGRVTVNDEFEIPRKFEFAGREFDLSNDRIYQKFSEIFQQEMRTAHRFIPRSGTYFPLFESVLAENDIPDDVKYLAIAESGLASTATSPVGAGGIWQFMPATARSHNLVIDSFIDERRNIFKATEAAAQYLLNSYRFMKNQGADDWLLAMCAYNAGNGGVARVMREQGASDFFDLIMRVDETNKYVWRSAAIKLIFDNEEKLFGTKFEREPSLLAVTRIEKIKLNGHHKLDDWAQAQGTVIKRIWELNPWINLHQRQRARYSAINDLILPAGEYEILLPAESQKNEELLAAAEKKLADRSQGHYTHHTVQRGDTLYGIARRYGTNINNIKSLNNLKSNTIVVGQKLQVMGTISQSPSISRTYTVKSGDSVEGIAKRLNVTPRYLISRNNLNVRQQGGKSIVIIHPGQKLYY